MNWLKLFNSNMKEKEIIKICEKYNINDYTINSDGSIDVDGNVYLFNKGLTKLPLKFRDVSGNFHCDRNKLTTLEGAPESVGGYFHCDYNQLTSLEGAPKSVGGNFHCDRNKLTTLEGAPKSVGGEIYSDVFTNDDYRLYIKQLNREQKLKELGI